MSTYVVTGGAGFIGSHVCGRLAELGHRVVNADSFADNYDYRIKVANVLESLHMPRRFESAGKARDLDWLSSTAASGAYRLVCADIRDEAALAALFAEERPDAVIHLAALPGVRASMAQPALYEDVNVKGTLSLLEAMRRCGIRKWVCASSSSVYGNTERTILSETDCTDMPISVYAASKKSCELLGHTYSHLYGIDGLMLRLFTVYGERQRPDLAIHKFTAMIERGEALPFYGDGASVRDYTYVGDIVNGILLALDYASRHERFYEIVNLGSHRPVALTELVSTLESVTGRTARLTRLPDQPGDMAGTCADIGKASQLLGYRPSMDFRAGIARFADWYRAGSAADGAGGI